MARMVFLASSIFFSLSLVCIVRGNQLFELYMCREDLRLLHEAVSAAGHHMQSQQTLRQALLCRLPAARSVPLDRLRHRLAYGGSGLLSIPALLMPSCNSASSVPCVQTVVSDVCGVVATGLDAAGNTVVFCGEDGSINVYAFDENYGTVDYSWHPGEDLGVATVTGLALATCGQWLLVYSHSAAVLYELEGPACTSAVAEPSVEPTSSKPADLRGRAVLRHRLPWPTNSDISAAALTANGETVAIGGVDGRIRIWHSSKPQSCVEIPDVWGAKKGSTDATKVRSISISQTGEQLAACCRGAVGLWTRQSVRKHKNMRKHAVNVIETTRAKEQITKSVEVQTQFLEVVLQKLNGEGFGMAIDDKATVVRLNSNRDGRCGASSRLAIIAWL
eukprot:SAG31_NODE_358_length_17033_cov_11.747077_3_plen_390_part_00